MIDVKISCGKQLEKEIIFIQGLDKPNLTKRIMIFDTLFLLIFIIVLSAIPAVIIWASIIEINETIDYFILIPFFLILIVWGLLEGVFIFLLVWSFRARKEVFHLANNNDYSTLEELLSLKDFKGQHKMKQKNLFKMKYSVAVLGDLQLKTSLNYLTDIMFCHKSLSWGLRRWSAFAIAKIGTAEAVHTLTKAKSLYKKPKRSMSPRPLTYELGSVFARYLHILRAYRAVNKLLKKLMEINGFIDENQMIEATL